MNEMTRPSNRLGQKLLEAILPESKRAFQQAEDWAVLGTLTGPVRTENQDRVLAARFSANESRSFRMIAVSDGMGGLPFGQEAASLTLSAFLSSLCTTEGQLEDRLMMAARHANAAVYSEFSGQSGATLSAVVETKSGAVAGVNVGDSRIYGLNTQDRSLSQLSVDDTLAGLAQGGAAIDVRHNASALLQHIGIGDEIEPNILTREAFLGASLLILTSDGIHWIGNSVLSLAALNAAEYVQLARRLLQLSEILGAHDNSSVAIMAPTSSRHESSRSSNGTFDLNFWTPEGKATFFLEYFRAIDPSSSRLAQESLAEDISAPEFKVPKKRPTKRKKRTKRPSAPEQEDLPIDRPELTIEFGQPKREEDETSR
jgi:serine/threonine protein phosphatase PrpC